MKEGKNKSMLFTFSVRPRNSHIGIAEPLHIDANVVNNAIEYTNFAIFPLILCCLQC